MSDMDLDSDVEETTEELLDQAVEAGPADPAPSDPPPRSGWETKARTVGKENQKLRSRLNEVMAEKFGSEVLELIPEEVKSWESRWDLAAKLAARLQTPAQADEAPAEPAAEEAAPEAISPAEAALATANATPASGTSTDMSDLTAKKILEIGQTDPARADALRAAKYRPQ